MRRRKKKLLSSLRDVTSAIKESAETGSVGCIFTDPGLSLLEYINDSDVTKEYNEVVDAIEHWRSK